MSKPILPFLETMITQVCNLSCQGCTNYSDLKHSGFVTWEQGQQWIKNWLNIVDIPDFGVIGGEPLINPELDQWMLGLRTLMPDSQLRLTTNGLLLHKWPDLLPMLNDIGNCVFKITVHVDDTELEQLIKEIFSKYHWETVAEHGIKRWRTGNNLRFQINRPQTFLKSYQGMYHNMSPYHSQPSDAFAACVQKTCPLLYQGKIYKCSTSALLLDTLDRFDRPNWQEWSPYIESGISPESPTHTVLEFLNNFGQPHQQCAQCPGSATTPLIHRLTVNRK
jgi:organic radical activating enzyme